MNNKSAIRKKWKNNKSTGRARSASVEFVSASVLQVDADNLRCSPKCKRKGPNNVKVFSHRPHNIIPNQNGNFIKKKSRKVEAFTNSERLFIRLVKLDISSKLKEAKESDDQSIIVIDPIKAKKSPITILKTKTHRKKLSHINTTESQKLEQELLKKFRKIKENQMDDSLSGSNRDSLKPYIYEKTDKSVSEAYKRTKDENGQMKLRCLLCLFFCEGFKQMSRHYKFKHKDTPIEEMCFCDIKGCDFKTVHKGKFKWHTSRHMLAGDKIRPDIYPCDQCNKVFNHRKGFLIHLRHMHRGPADSTKKAAFPCSTCKFSATSKPNLQTHINKKHMPNAIKPNFKCNICDYETHYEDFFKEHLTRVHLEVQ